ncbi:MAG: YdcF family protein [Mycobacteriaceae bacterium]|nr:YdcF family protein [Mycobacteriaceae bacterium]
MGAGTLCTRRTRARRRRRRARALRVLAAVVAAVGALAALGWPVYVRPQVDPLRHADAVVVLGGTAYERYDIGHDIARRGYAHAVVLSRSTGPDDPVMDDYCAPRAEYRVLCFVPDPWTTRGEAQEIARLTARYGWRHLIVVTFTPHVSRARYIIGKCFRGELTMIASPSPSGLRFWSWMYLRQSAGYVRAALDRGCPV